MCGKSSVRSEGRSSFVVLGLSPSKNNKKKTSTTSQWLSPARNRPRSKSLDDTNADPSNTSTSITDSNSEDDKSDAKTNDKDNSRYVY